MEEDSSNADIIGVDEYDIPVYKEIDVADLDEVSCDASGPRLIISNIVIENFKSYAGVKVLGPFHKNFTAIIGPNGSGKSNVIDSILFVFGFRATKIRSKKLSVLIHDSEEHRGLNSCSVTVHFQQILDEGSREDNNFKVVEGSEFEVSRTAFKDGSSYYKIKDHKVHYKEIEKVLLEAGVDLVHNRFLILQGEVEQIALMKAKSTCKNEDGMLEFLEDIIGSNRFQEPIQLLAGRLSDLAELKTEKYQRVKIIEGEKNELADERNEALTFLQLQNDVTKAKHKQRQKDLFSSRHTEKVCKETQERVAEETKELKIKCLQVVSMIKEKTKQHTEFLKKCTKVSKDKETNKEKFQWYEERDVKVQEEVKHALRTVKKLESRIKEEEEKLNEYKMVPERQEKDIEVMRMKMQKMELEKKEQERKFDEVMATFQDETKELQGSKFAKESELLELQQSVSQHKQKYQLAQGELDLLRSSQNRDANKVADIERNISRLQASVEERKGLWEEAKKRFPGVKESLQKATMDLEELNNADNNKKDVIKELSTKVEIARTNLYSAQNQNKVGEFLMGLKRSGKVTAIHGRLGDLGAIDEKYDIAISTACGLLDYTVVDDMNSAQKCIEELQRAEVGRASFIGLDKMAVWKGHCTNKNRTFPENVPRLFDLVKVDNPDLMPAFYFALRDTLVAKDIHQATRIAYGSTRYRVVTLGGQLIDLTGTMSGGGKKVTRGKMGSQIKQDVNPKALQKMEVELDRAQREARSCQESRFRLQQSIEGLQKSHREVSTSIQKLDNEITSMQGQLKSFEAQLKQLQTSLSFNKQDDKKVKEQEKKVELLKQDYEKVQKVATDMEDQIHNLHQDIMEVGGSQFKSIETKKNLLESQVEQMKNTINKLTVAVTTAQRKATKSEGSMVEMRKEMKETVQKSISLRAESANIEKEAHRLLTQLNKVEAEVKETQEELSRLSEGLSEHNKEEKESERLLMEVGHRLKKAQEEEKQASERCEAIKLELSELKLHQIDDGAKERLVEISEDEAQKIDTKEILKMIAIAGEELKKMKPNMASIQEYKKKEEIFLKRVDQLTRVSGLKDAQKKTHGVLKKRRLDEFMAGFSRIKNKLKEMYQTITLGGNAELELVDTLDPFAEGIVFSVRPPKKSWKNISNLSGGEKTLSSLALIFALHQYKATPFYVMDEIDAALDFKNASIVANYIKHRTENAQFIVISLRSNTFELCDRLIGIYKTSNCTKSITVNLAKNKINSRIKNKKHPGVIAGAVGVNEVAVGVNEVAVCVTEGTVGVNGGDVVVNGGDVLVNEGEVGVTLSSGGVSASGSGVVGSSSSGAVEGSLSSVNGEGRWSSVEENVSNNVFDKDEEERKDEEEKKDEEGGKEG